MSREEHSEDNQQVISNRLRMLESNMARLINQHQALAPLADLANLIPEVNRHKDSIRLVEDELQQLSHQISQFMLSLKHTQPKAAFSAIKDITLLTNQLKREIKELEDYSKKQDREQTYKARIKTTLIQKGVETVLEELKQDTLSFISSFKQSVSTQYARISESEAIEVAVDQRTKESQAEFNGHLVNLKREIGWLECQLEYLKDKELRARIKENPQKDPLQLASFEPKFYLQSFLQFQESNVDRMKYQLQILYNTLKDQKSSQPYKFPNSKSVQLQFLKDKHYSLSNQIEGSKSKRMEDMLKLQNKLERLQSMISESGRDMSQLGVSTQLRVRVREARVVGANHDKYLGQYMDAIDLKFREISQSL